MAKRILVTPRSVTQGGHPSLRRFTDAGYEVVLSRPGVQPSEAELLELLPGCVGLLAGVEPISAKVLEAARYVNAPAIADKKLYAKDLKSIICVDIAGK